MLPRLVALVAALCLAAPAALAQRPAGERSRPGLGDLQRLLLGRGAEAPHDIAEHRCESRPSALFGDNTYRCTITLTGGAELSLVITYDGTWVIVGQ